MTCNQRTPIHHGIPTDSPSNRANPRFQHQYSELLLATTDSDCSATYAMPTYGGSGSDGSHATYSTTTAIYHQANCQCHLVTCQPPQCISPAHQSVQSAEGSSNSSNSNSNPMTNSITKEAWISKEIAETKINRLNQPIAWIWSTLSVLLFILCTLTLTQTSWLVNSSTGESLGLINQCKKDPTTHKIECFYYEGLSALKLPSVSWKLTLIIFSIADTLLGLSSVLALGTLALATTKTRRYISFLAGYTQLFAAILFTTAALFYMVGLDSEPVKDICGSNTDVFQAGSCHIGWSYLLLVISSSLCLLLPVLSHYIGNTLCTKPEKIDPPEYVA